MSLEPSARSRKCASFSTSAAAILWPRCSCRTSTAPMIAISMTSASIARDDQAVAVRQGHRAVAAELELFVEMREISRADGREHHAAEAAVQLVETARQGDEPFAAEQALHGPADMGLPFRRELVITEERVVVEGRADRAGRGQPVAVVIDDGEAVDALYRLLARLQQGSELGDRGRLGAVHLQPADDADDA